MTSNDWGKILLSFYHTVLLPFRLQYTVNFLLHFIFNLAYRLLKYWKLSEKYETLIAAENIILHTKYSKKDPCMLAYKKIILMLRVKVTSGHHFQAGRPCLIKAYSNCNTILFVLTYFFPKRWCPLLFYHEYCIGWGALNLHQKITSFLPIPVSYQAANWPIESGIL